MGGLGTITRSSSQRKGKMQALQMMYFLEGGLLMANNLLQTDAWVDDEKRTHCSVCVQQFLPFRRRHHCRTCGEVVCGGCSSQRAVRLTDMNVECATRVCTYCVIRATDASIKANDDALRETQLDHGRLSTVSVLSLASPAVRRNKQLTLLSAESELTRGSIVQLWPQPVPPNETARLQVARHSTIRSAESDPTMNLLVNIVARTLECPAAFIGIMDDASLWIKASVGLDDRVTHIPREGCMCAHTVVQDRTMIIDDTTADKHFHAEEQAVGNNSMRYYAGAPIRVRGHGIGVVCALDAEPHASTTDAMKSTLEAVANIVSEVLEQRIASAGTTTSPTGSAGLSCYVRPQTTHTDVDLHASLHGLNVLPRPQQTTAIGHHTAQTSLYLPPQYASKITAAVDYFHQLQRSVWAEQSTEADSGGIRTFELFKQDEPFTRSVVKVTGTCRGVVAQLLDYEDALLYQQFFSHVSRRCELNGHTWMDSVSLHPSFGAGENENLSVLTHQREYPDGSNVVVAVARNAPEQDSRSGLLIGWFVAPCDGLNTVNVSCITAQAFENQAHERNLSLDLLRRLNQKIAMARFFHLPSDEAPMSSTLQVHLRPALRDNQRSETSEDDLDSSDSNDRDSTVVNTSGSARTTSIGRATDSSVEAAPESNRSALVAIHQTEQASELNQNEQMLLDLLDKTIGTQEILAQRQHEMAGVINLHGSQLQRISSALERVESLLFDKDGKPLKRLVRKPKQAPST